MIIMWSFPFRAEFPGLFSVTVSEAAVGRCSIKSTPNCAKPAGKHLWQSFFLMQFFRVIEIQKVRAKYKIVNRYSATKRAHLYCKWASFKFSISSSHLTLSWRRAISYRNQSIDLLCKLMDWFLYGIGLHHERVKRSLTLLCWDIHQFVFLTWIHVRNLSFSVLAAFKYWLHGYIQLVYMEWKSELDLFKPWGSFSSVYRDEICGYNRTSVFTLLSLKGRLVQKISLDVSVHIKTIPWTFRILNLKNFRVKYP